MTFNAIDQPTYEYMDVRKNFFSFSMRMNGCAATAKQTRQLHRFWPHISRCTETCFTCRWTNDDEEHSTHSIFQSKTFTNDEICTTKGAICLYMFFITKNVLFFFSTNDAINESNTITHQLMAHQQHNKYGNFFKQKTTAKMIRFYNRKWRRVFLDFFVDNFKF